MIINKMNGPVVLCVPIANLSIEKDGIGQEHQVDRVTFIDAKKLPYIRKKLGIPMKISTLRNKHKTILGGILTKSDTYAIIRFTGRLETEEAKTLNRIREELSILSLSQIGYAKRRSNFAPTIAREHGVGITEYFAINSNDATLMSSFRLRGKVGPLVLNKKWKYFQNKAFYFKLLRIIRGEIGVARQWKNDLRNAAIMAGQSQCMIDLPQAFLWNMIAIELLLTHQGDKYAKELPKRAEAMLGWVNYWSDDDYESRITDLYNKRCELVHNGVRENILIDDLLFTDDLILNLFTNIVSHIDIFCSKEALIAFSEKVKAEHILGVKPKVRPKTFKYFKHEYTKYDYQQF
jgi:hypothetical protein